MYKLLLTGLLGSILLQSCDGWSGEKVKGSGHLQTEERSISNARDIRIEGDFIVDLVPDSKTSLTVEADDNLLPYIVTKQEDGALVLRTRDNVWFSTSNRAHITVHTDLLESVDLSGSGSVTGKGKFSGAEKMDLDISGSGKVTLEVNTPAIKTNISGSGQMNLAGETKSLIVDISGTGNFKGEELKAEDVNIDITGSGNARVFADASLKAGITGSGNVYYRGKATISSDITGSGAVKQIE